MQMTFPRQIPFELILNHPYIATVEGLTYWHVWLDRARWHVAVRAVCRHHVGVFLVKAWLHLLADTDYGLKQHKYNVPDI